jgi:prepilin-type N-terminal cleavage/methylation domain-containing protein
MNTHPDKPTPRKRDGMTLMEVMIAMTILVMLIVSNSALTMKFAERQRTVGLGAYRTAALSGLVDKYMAMPFDSLAVRTGCKTVTATTLVPFGYTSCVNVTSVTSSQSTVQIILTPSALTRVDTVSFTRAKMSTTGPLG